MTRSSLASAIVIFLCFGQAKAAPPITLDCSQLTIVEQVLEQSFGGGEFKLLGIGYDGFTLRVTDKTGKKFVVKFANAKKEWGVAALKHEVAIGAIMSDKNASNHFVRPKSGPNGTVVMEFIEGAVALDQWLARQNAPLDRALAISFKKQLKEIQSELKRVGVVHSDIRPANLVVNPNGRLIVIDYGIAALPGGYAAHLGGIRGNLGEFQSPGQALNKPASFKDDAHSLLAVEKLIDNVSRFAFRRSQNPQVEVSINDQSYPSGQTIKFSINGGPKRRGLLADRDGSLIWVYENGAFQSFEMASFTMIN